MKWNIEWVDLQNIEHMISDCWRMSERHLEKYCKELSRQQDLIFAGKLGMKFLELMRRSIEQGQAIEWSKLQRDVRLMKELIQDGQAQHEAYWKSQYQALTANTSAYFSSEFGKAFTEQLAAKLELDMSEEQRMLQHDINKIRKICASCHWEDEARVKQELSHLTKEEKWYFSSWLGDAFIHVLQQRYGEREPVEEPALHLELEQKSGGKAALKAKILWTIFICISIGAIILFLYMQSQGDQSKFKLQNIVSIFSKTDDTKSPEDAVIDQTAEVMIEQADRVIEAQNQSEMNTSDQTVVSDETDDDVQTSKLVSNQKEPDIPDTDTADTGIESVQKPDAVLEVLPQYQEFYQDYPDLFGWLKIPGTQIDHPVMQPDDEERGELYYYLHRDYTGRDSEAGSLFVESRSSCYPQDQNTVIYGHNMSNGQNFGMLERYKEKSFFDEHSLIQYDTIYETGTYQIAAVVLTRVLYQDEEGFRYYRFYNYDTEREFQDCIDFIEQNQLYDTGVELQYGDQMLMLSTCEYSIPNGRLVVIAKKQ